MIKALLRMLRSMDLNRTLIGFILIGSSAISAGTPSAAPPSRHNKPQLKPLESKSKILNSFQRW